MFLIRDSILFFCFLFVCLFVLFFLKCAVSFVDFRLATYQSICCPDQTNTTCEDKQIGREFRWHSQPSGTVSRYKEMSGVRTNKIWTSFKKHITKFSFYASMELLGESKRGHIFPKSISLKVNVIVWLELECAFYRSAVQYVTHYATETLSNQIILDDFLSSVLHI